MSESAPRETASLSSVKPAEWRGQDLPVLHSQESAEAVTEFFASLHPFFSRLIIYNSSVIYFDKKVPYPQIVGILNHPVKDPLDK